MLGLQITAAVRLELFADSGIVGWPSDALASPSWLWLLVTSGVADILNEQGEECCRESE